MGSDRPSVERSRLPDRHVTRPTGTMLAGHRRRSVWSEDLFFARGRLGWQPAAREEPPPGAPILSGSPKAACSDQHPDPCALASIRYDRGGTGTPPRFWFRRAWCFCLPSAPPLRRSTPLGGAACADDVVMWRTVMASRGGPLCLRLIAGPSGRPGLPEFQHPWTIGGSGVLIDLQGVRRSIRSVCRIETRTPLLAARQGSSGVSARLTSSLDPQGPLSRPADREGPCGRSSEGRRLPTFGSQGSDRSSISRPRGDWSRPACRSGYRAQGRRKQSGPRGGHACQRAQRPKRGRKRHRRPLPAR